MTILSALLALGIIVIVFIIIFKFMLYIIQAIALFKIAGKEGSFSARWIAWIPIPLASGFLITHLVEDDVHESLRGNLTIIYTLSVVTTILFGGTLPFLPIISIIIFIYGFYYLVNKYSESAKTHLIWAILTITISIPFQLLILMNKENRFKKEEEF